MGWLSWFKRAPKPKAPATTKAQWIHDQIVAHAKSGDAGSLASASASLGSGDGMVFGMIIGDLPEREELAREALDAFRELLPNLPDDQCEATFQIVTRASLAVDLEPRRNRFLAARQEVADRAAERRNGKRARLIREAGTEPRNVGLERAIAASPEDADTYSVLADWLQQQAHPRGELIALQLRAESEPALQAAVEAHLTEHTAALLGPLLPHRQTHDGTEREAFTWRRGFIDHARISYDEHAEDRPVSLAEILGLLLAHPSGCLLSGLDVGMNGPGDASLEDVVEELRARAPATLRSLLLGDFTQEQSDIAYFDVGNISPIWPALSGLRKLVVHGGSFTLGTIDHAQLEHAEFKTGGLSVASARAIAAAQWPRLRHLDVWYGDENYGGEATIDDVRPLLARADLGELVHLGLMNAAFTDEICAALPGAAFAAQLRELDLSLGTMSDVGAQALARSGAFPKLTKLDVSRNYLSDDAIAALKEAFPEVIATDQRDPSDDRYPSVGE